jgi:hypothetical protein
VGSAASLGVCKKWPVVGSVNILKNYVRQLQCLKFQSLNLGRIIC